MNLMMRFVGTDPADEWQIANLLQSSGGHGSHETVIRHVLEKFHPAGGQYLAPDGIEVIGELNEEQAVLARLRPCRQPA